MGFVFDIRIRTFTPPQAPPHQLKTTLNLQENILFQSGKSLKERMNPPFYVPKNFAKISGFQELIYLKDMSVDGRTSPVKDKKGHLIDTYICVCIKRLKNWVVSV